MRILNFGSCNIDCVYRVEHIVSPGETVAAVSTERYAGGKGLNQSIAAARAGATVYHAGCIGADGAFLSSLLCSSGVHVDFLQTVDAETGHAIIQVGQNGDNSIVIAGGANRAITREQVERVLSHFSRGDLLLLQNEIALLDEILACARKRGLRIFLNPSPFDERLRTVDLKKLECLVLNEIEARLLFGTDDEKALREIVAQTAPALKLLLTLGERGCVYIEGGRTLAQAAFPVRAVDTTAAGDTFTGYFVACLAQGAAIEEALKTASAAAALAVTVDGAAPSVPTRQAVDVFLKQNG